MNSLSPREHLLKRPRFPVVQDNSVVSVSSLKQPPTAPGLDILADAVQQKGDALHLGDMCPKQEVVPAKVMSPVNQIPSSPAQYVIPNHRNPNQKIVLTVHGSDVEIGHQQSTDSPIMESIQAMPVKNGASTVIDNVDIETEMLDFMRRYASEVSRNNGRKPQTPVRDLRHMIPLLIMHLYGVKAEQSHRKSKVKGMWWTTPKDWPSGVPFCDPNNSKLPTPDGSLSKPKKETLIQMFNFLMGKYNQKIVDSPSSSQEDLNMAKTILHAFTIKPSHDSASDNLNLLASVVTGSAHEESKSTLLGRRPSSEPSEQIEPKCLKVDNPPQPVLLSPPIAQALSSGSVTQVSVVGPPSHLLKPKAACLSPPLPNTSCTSGGKIQAPKNLSRIAEVPKENGWDLRRQSEAEAPPKMSVEVQDDEEEVFDWDPVADICRLNEQKFRYIVAKKIVPQRDLGHLHLANEMLVKMRQISMDCEEEKVKFLEKAHDFSLTLDLCHMLGHMPEKHRVKWSDTQGAAPVTIVTKQQNSTIEELVLDLSELKLADPSSAIVCVSDGNRICLHSNQEDHSEDVNKLFPENDEGGEGQMESVDDLLVALSDYDGGDVHQLQPSELTSDLWDPQMTLDINISDITDCLNDTPPVTPMTVPIPVTVEEMEIDPGPSRKSRRRRTSKKD